MEKHAYLIMAHTDCSLLSKLLTALDDERNDIYIHLDKKASFSPSDIYMPRYSNCTYIERMNVTWGGDSQIKCEIALLKAATKHKYAYYHLISGQDLPLKSQTDIHEFFKQNSGKNYIKIDSRAMTSGYALERIREYHLFQNFIGRKEGHFIGLLRRVDNMFLTFQKAFKINRLKNCPKKIYKGTNWFSITDAMAHIILSEEHFIRKYCCSICADEIFLQTVAMNSDLASTIVDEDLRYIDWERGNPYTFCNADYNALTSTAKLFARKFSDDADSEITSKILHCIKSK